MLFPLPFILQVSSPSGLLTHEEVEPIARAIRAALDMTGHNQKTAAAAMGISESQTCRLIQSGNISPHFRRLGPDFWRCLFVNLGEVVGVETSPFSIRRTA